MPRTKQCPRCHALGKDTRGNNLAVYDDGHSYCYSCRYYIPSPTTVTSLKSKLSAKQFQPNADTSIDFLSEQYTHKLPDPALNWLRKYGITDDEIHRYNLCYDLEKDRLIFPVLDGIKTVGYSSRYFGSDSTHPRYITRIYRVGFYPLIRTRENQTWVLVEDYVSAIKVGRHYNCIPLLGSSIPISLILKLIHLAPILRIWLDRDKAIDAIKYAMRTRQFIPDCATIITEKDPKEYTDKEITEIVSGSLKILPTT